MSVRTPSSRINFANSLLLELEPIRVQVAAAYDLLGGEHSDIHDADANAAQMLLERLLARIDGLIESCNAPDLAPTAEVSQ